MDIKNAKLWIEGLPVEYAALNQVRDIAGLPVVAGHVAVMPDVHLGKGATVGSVIPTRGAIIPAAVGVDIGCGMVAVKTDLTASELPDNLSHLRAEIEKLVPVGFNFHKKDIRPKNYGGADGLKVDAKLHALESRVHELEILERYKNFDFSRAWHQVGTLGGGNHFIELCLDENQDVWVMLHSGSRNIGKTIGEIAINMAKELAVKENTRLPNKDLAWLNEGTLEFNQYVQALLWAQDYAALNRDLMLLLVMHALKKVFKRDIGTTAEAINCHHNYASFEHHFGSDMWITRKGAVSAKAGQMGIIPGSMGARSFITRGLGNADSYHSSSHGAGRVMSRSKAKESFSIEDLISQTAGVECRKDRGVIDEIPGAYKDIDAVMAAQKDLVETVHSLKQVMCIKG